MSDTPAPSRIGRRALGRGAAAIIDQALFALSNFTVNLGLARVLSETDYGAVAVAFTALYLVVTVLNALFLEPMQVLASGRFAEDARGYMRTMLVVLAGVSVTAVTAIEVMALLLRHGVGAAVSTALAGIGWVIPLMFLCLILRRAAFLLGRAGIAIAGGAAYMVLIIGIGWPVAHLSVFTIPRAFALIAGSYAVVALGLISAMGLWPGRAALAAARMIAREHLRYGRWSGGAVIVSWAAQNMPYLVLPAFAGLSASASYRAAANLFLPIGHSIGALTTVLLPALTRARGEPPRFRARLFEIVLLLGGGAALYGILVFLLRQPIFQLLYGGKYTEALAILPFVACGLVCYGLSNAFSMASAAYERPERNFRASLISAVITLLVAPAAIIKLGLFGAAIGGIIGDAARTVALAIGLARRPLTLPDHARKAPSALDGKIVKQGARGG